MSEITAQVKKYSFADGLSNNIIFFEKVRDTVVCVRNTFEGLKWTMFDSELNVLSAEADSSRISPAVLRQQLKPLRNGVGYVKQRITGNRFEISVKEMPLSSKKTYDSLTTIYTEQYEGQPPSQLNFYFLSSPESKYSLLYRLERLRANSDSVFMKAIVLDEHLGLLNTYSLTIPVKQPTETLLAVGIDDKGDVFAVSGDHFNSYVLGTQLNICFFRTETGRYSFGTVKVQRRKLQDMMIESVADTLRFYCTASNSNIEKEIDGITTVSVSKRNFGFRETHISFPKEVRKEIGRIISAPNKTALNEMSFQGLEYRSGNETDLIASIKNLIRTYTNTRRISTYSPFRSSVSALNMANLSSAPAGNFIINPTPSDYFKRNYRELFVVIENSNDGSIITPLYQKSGYEGLQFPKHYFKTPDARKLVFSLQKRGKYQLAISNILNNGSTTDPQLIDETTNCFVDQTMNALNVKGRSIFFYKNAENNSTGLISAK